MSELAAKDASAAAAAAAAAVSCCGAVQDTTEALKINEVRHVGDCRFRW